MKESAEKKVILKRGTIPRKAPDPYSSVEISVDGITFAYHFKLWNIPPMPMCLLVKEDSKILSRLKVGDVLNTKFYSDGYRFPRDCRETTIQTITKNDQGPFRGHYFVGLEVLEG
ncbi:MAG: hypothetical protein ABII26_12020 [Pseudomonadota bacterium]